MYTVGTPLPIQPDRSFLITVVKFGLVICILMFPGFSKFRKNSAGSEALIRPRGYKTFFMLNSTEYEIFPAHKC